MKFLRISLDALLILVWVFVDLSCVKHLFVNIIEENFHGGPCLCSFFRYFELKPTACIAENLKGHCLTEFPVIKVLAPSCSDAEYTLLSKGKSVNINNRLHVSWI